MKKRNNTKNGDANEKKTTGITRTGKREEQDRKRNRQDLK